MKQARIIAEGASRMNLRLRAIVDLHSGAAPKCKRCYGGLPEIARFSLAIGNVPRNHSPQRASG